MKYYKIRLIDPGSSKLTIIKTIKSTLFHMSLRHCKNLIDDTPSTILLTPNRTEARKLAKTLREKGATIKSTIHTIAS